MQGKESPALRWSQPGRLRAGHGACPSRGPALRAAVTRLPGGGVRAACGRVSSLATASACAGRSSRGSPCSAQVHLGHLLPGPARGPPGLPERPQDRVRGGLVSWCCSLGGAGHRPGPHSGGAGWGAAGEVGQRPGRSAAPPAQDRPSWAGRHRGEGARAGEGASPRLLGRRQVLLGWGQGSLRPVGAAASGLL